jgi:fructose-1,6-bisphosphatase I
MATTNSGQETEKVNTNIVTLTRFLTEEQAKHPEATGDFTYVVPCDLKFMIPG